MYVLYVDSKYSFFEQTALLPVCIERENSMRTAIYILLILLTVLLIIAYSVLVMAHDADERAERMYRKWKESKGADDEIR